MPPKPAWNHAKPRPRERRTPSEISLEPQTLAIRPHPELRPGFFADSVFSVLAAVQAHRGLMTVEDLAPLLGISTDVLHRMCRKGSIPVFVVPGCSVRRFDPATIAFWLTQHNPILRQVKKAS